MNSMQQRLRRRIVINRPFISEEHYQGRKRFADKASKTADEAKTADSQREAASAHSDAASFARRPERLKHLAIMRRHLKRTASNANSDDHAHKLRADESTKTTLTDRLASLPKTHAEAHARMVSKGFKHVTTSKPYRHGKHVALFHTYEHPNGTRVEIETIGNHFIKAVKNSALDDEQDHRMEMARHINLAGSASSKEEWQKHMDAAAKHQSLVNNLASGWKSHSTYKGHTILHRTVATRFGTLHQAKIDSDEPMTADPKAFKTQQEAIGHVRKNIDWIANSARPTKTVPSWKNDLERIHSNYLVHHHELEGQKVEDVHDQIVEMGFKRVSKTNHGGSKRYGQLPETVHHYRHPDGRLMFMHSVGSGAMYMTEHAPWAKNSVRPSKQSELWRIPSHRPHAGLSDAELSGATESALARVNGLKFGSDVERLQHPDFVHLSGLVAERGHRDYDAEIRAGRIRRRIGRTRFPKQWPVRNSLASDASVSAKRATTEANKSGADTGQYAHSLAAAEHMDAADDYLRHGSKRKSKYHSEMAHHHSLMANFHITGNQEAKKRAARVWANAQSVKNNATSMSADPFHDSKTAHDITHLILDDATKRESVEQHRRAIKAHGDAQKAHNDAIANLRYKIQQHIQARSAHEYKIGVHLRHIDSLERRGGVKNNQMPIDRQIEKLTGQEAHLASPTMAYVAVKPHPNHMTMLQKASIHYAGVRKRAHGGELHYFERRGGVKNSSSGDAREQSDSVIHTIRAGKSSPWGPWRKHSTHQGKTIYVREAKTDGGSLWMAMKEGHLRSEHRPKFTDVNAAVDHAKYVTNSNSSPAWTPPIGFTHTRCANAAPTTTKYHNPMGADTKYVHGLLTDQGFKPDSFTDQGIGLLATKVTTYKHPDGTLMMVHSQGHKVQKIVERNTVTANGSTVGAFTGSPMISGFSKSQTAVNATPRLNDLTRHSQDAMRTSIEASESPRGSLFQSHRLAIQRHDRAMKLHAEAARLSKGDEVKQQIHLKLAKTHGELVNLHRHILGN